jgi:hypothetical protein
VATATGISKEQGNGKVYGCAQRIRGRDPEAQLREAHEGDLDVEATENVHFEHARLDPESGEVFCLSSGPSKEAVQRRVHETARHPADEIYELPVEVE